MLKSLDRKARSICRRCMRISSMLALSLLEIRRHLDRTAVFTEEKVMRRLILQKAHALVAPMSQILVVPAGGLALGTSDAGCCDHQNHAKDQTPHSPPPYSETWRQD